MAKKLVIVWLSLTVLLFSNVTVFAEDTAQGKFLNRNIYINGHRIDNYFLEYPLFTYQGVTYFPLTTTMQEMLGIRFECDQESHTILLTRSIPNRTDLDQKTLKCNLVDPAATELADYTVLVKTDNWQDAAMPGEVFNFYHYLTRPVDLGNYKVLKRGDVFYLPLRALSGASGLGWDLAYDDYSGVYISTIPGTLASTYFDKSESSYNKGLANYIRYRNPAITPASALNLTFLFKHEGTVYRVNETLLMAMAEKESTFRVDCVSDGDTIGLMQILSSTARNYGVTRKQLFDPHINIQFGAMYISSRLERYGVTSTALAAYNQGSVPVSRGTVYTTRYSSRITTAEAALTDYLVRNGYGLGE